MTRPALRAREVPSGYRCGLEPPASPTAQRQDRGVRCEHGTGRDDKKRGNEQSALNGVAFRRGRRNPQENLLIWGIQLEVFFTPRLEQDKGKILLAIVPEE